MGLLDILNGMQNGPRGQSAPSTNNSSGGMSPLTIALMGLLAYKAIKHMAPNPPNPGTNAPGLPPNSTTSGAPGGGLGGLLQGGLGGLLQGGLGGLQSQLGGLLAGGSGGSVLSTGLSDLLKQFQQNGLGDVAKSWVDNGPNKEIGPSDLSKVLDEDQIKTLMAHSGMSRDELLAGLSQQLPEVINRLTPQGRLPSDQEAAHLVRAAA
jgi:uncharacterized protein YidB (DUF937 family)